MFLRFSKGKFDSDNVRTYRKCVFLGDSVVYEYGDKIVGFAKLNENREKSLVYDVVVAKNSELGSMHIARYIKDMIGKSNKFTANPTTKRRKYQVREVDKDELPVKAKIVFDFN